MDTVKVEHHSISDTPPPFLSSEHDFHSMNDEGPVSFDVLQKGAKVRSVSYSVNYVSLTYMRRNCSICMGSCVCPEPHFVYYEKVCLNGDQLH